MFSQRPWDLHPWRFSRQGDKDMAELIICWQQSVFEGKIILDDIQVLSDSILVISEI